MSKNKDLHAKKVNEQEEELESVFQKLKKSMEVNGLAPSTGYG